MNAYPYRVWPDGTVQDANEQCYPFLSDDYIVVQALDEEDADYLVNVKSYERKV